MMWMNRAARSLTQPTLRRAYHGVSASSSSMFRPAAAVVMPRPQQQQQQQSRSVWSSGQEPFSIAHPSATLTPAEISAAASAVKASVTDAGLRFIAITASEGSKHTVMAAPRQAEVIALGSDGIGMELLVDLTTNKVTESRKLPPGVQPMFTPEDCEVAEEICKSSPEVQKVLLERYGIPKDKIATHVAADPWSISLAGPADEAMVAPDPATGMPRRCVQTFLYYRPHGTMADNQYAHPIDLVPVVDLNSKTVVKIDGVDRLPAPKIPEVSVQYHRDMLHTNSYLATTWREDTLKALDIKQPDGPSFKVTDGNLVEWQGWSLRVGFHYREGLVLHDVKYQGRPVMKRGSLVEMSVPYGDPNPPYQRKCALDVGDYGLGYCANSLELGCDCLGHIHYFDATLNNMAGEPFIKKKVVCMHEEDDGILWKHVEYRNGHNESRRARELVLSSIATVVNYEYLFYWRLKLDGSIDFEIRLTGELSTNLPSASEDPDKPDHGILCSPGVNSQIHQHMFCARLDMNVDGDKNTVSEINVETAPSSPGNPYGNIFAATETRLNSEKEAVRMCDANKARLWKIANAEGAVNPITKKPTAYKLIPFTRGPAMPPLLTHPEECAVSKKSKFATAHLWVTQYDQKERYPAGEYPTQATAEQVKTAGGLPIWIENRNADLSKGSDVVLWHSFGVTHVPRVEDFPVMPCESTGFTLKPDGFFSGNPSIDLPPETNKESKLNEGCCNT